MAQAAVTVTETLDTDDLASPVLRTPAAAAEMANLSGAPVPQKRGRIAVRDRVRVAARVAASARLAATLRSAVSIRGTLRTGLYARLAENLAVDGRLTAQQRVVLREVVRLLGQGSPAATRYALMRAGFRVSDRLDMRQAVALSEAIDLTPRAARALRAVRAITDTLALEATVGLTLMVTVLASDAVELRDDTVLQALFRGHLADTLDFILDVVDPGGDVTTWAMNVRTNAVTEYLNYGFNAFARSDNDVYLAAGDDGLYELAGPDDAGVPVVADIVSGLAAFSGVFLSGLQAAYLGVRGKGEFFLKLTSGEGKSTVYGVKTQSMRTARVNLGKGWRARHMTWELTSTGQDFDLLDVTFLPIQSTRRI